MEEKLSTIYLRDGRNALQYGYEPERKVQADSDRSDIRVFETGLSTQRHGDYWQGKRTAEEEECHRLIEVAKAHELERYFNSWKSLIGILEYRKKIE